jgi:hypothetical protein
MREKKLKGRERGRKNQRRKAGSPPLETTPVKTPIRREEIATKLTL